MKAKFIALAVAGALATAGMAPAPANANKFRDVAGLLIGIAAIAAISDAANRNNTRANVSSRDTSRDVYRPIYVQPRRHVVIREPRAKPRLCVLREYTRDGWVRVYGRRCMARLGWSRNGDGWVQRPSYHIERNNHEDDEYYHAER